MDAGAWDACALVTLHVDCLHPDFILQPLKKQIGKVCDVCVSCSSSVEVLSSLTIKRGEHIS